MNILVQPRVRLQVSNMSNKSERRHSKRLAAAASYDDTDGDFQFTRHAKKAKTTLEVELAASVAPKTRNTRRKTTRASNENGNRAVDREEGEREIGHARNEPRSRGVANQIVVTPSAAADGLQRVRAESQQIMLPFSDTPIQERNKEFRKKGGTGGGRRSSLGARGRRASSLIESGQSALPHRELDTSVFYKHIESEGLSEPRRMRQLLMWCGERAHSQKPPHGDQETKNAALGALAMEKDLLKDFGARSELSDWFAREDVPKAPIVLKPNPKNEEHDAKIMELETRIKKLREEKKSWQALSRQLSTEEQPLFPQEGATQTSLPDRSLLEADDARILSSLTAVDTSFGTLKRETQARLRAMRLDLEFKIDCLADNVHKIDQRVVTGGREADRVLRLSAARLRERNERELKSAGTRQLPNMEVLRSLAKILPEGG